MSEHDLGQLLDMALAEGGPVILDAILRGERVGKVQKTKSYGLLWTSVSYNATENDEVETDALRLIAPGRAWDLGEIGDGWERWKAIAVANLIERPEFADWRILASPRKGEDGNGPIILRVDREVILRECRTAIANGKRRKLFLD